MAFHNRVTALLDIEHPVLLAPMDVVADGTLAAAVSSAGGLGLIGGGYGDGAWLEREFAAAGNTRVGCGFITWSLAKQPALLDRALDHAPAAVMLSFGDATPFAAKIRAAGAKLICQVQTLRQAQDAAGAGADVIVAQGTEAGGHGAARGTMTLVPEVADALPDVPVIAAGGIADGRGLAAALMLGAEGVLMGTRFYASQEAAGHAEAKRRIVKGTGDDTLRSIVFDISRRNVWPDPYNGRVMRGRALRTGARCRRLRRRGRDRRRGARPDPRSAQRRRDRHPHGGASRRLAAKRRPALTGETTWRSSTRSWAPSVTRRWCASTSSRPRT